MKRVFTILGGTILFLYGLSMSHSGSLLCMGAVAEVFIHLLPIFYSKKPENDYKIELLMPFVVFPRIDLIPEKMVLCASHSVIA